MLNVGKSLGIALHCIRVTIEGRWLKGLQEAAVQLPTRIDKSYEF